MINVPFEKNKFKVLLLEGVHSHAVDSFRQAGYQNVEYYKGSLSSDDLTLALRDAHFVGIRSRTQLTSELLQEAKNLSAIGCFCIGTNQVDINAAAELGIPVFNAPFSNTRSVAELVLGEILLLLRGIPAKNAMLHRGQWFKSAEHAFEARGKKLGIIGYGHIGTQLGILAESLGISVYFYDIETKLPLGNAQQIRSMSTLLQTCDVISLHVPATPATENLIDANALSQMKQNALFINASRGNVVDITALSHALESKRIAGAAIDVFPIEPETNELPFSSPLCEFDNVILTPHIGGSTQEAQENIAVEVAGKIIKYVENGSTLSSVNFPQVSLPEQKAAQGGVRTSRFIHIHQNRPGILNNINSIFAEDGINISGQYLQTNALHGYVVIDVETDISEKTLQKLNAIEGTIKARLIHGL